jgi:hypothetical protein
MNKYVNNLQHRPESKGNVESIAGVRWIHSMSLVHIHIYVYTKLKHAQFGTTIKFLVHVYKYIYTYMYATYEVSVALSPQANYTDWATATCRRNLVPTFVDRGVSRTPHIRRRISSCPGKVVKFHCYDSDLGKYYGYIENLRSLRNCYINIKVLPFLNHY